jgi:hypothetical protein
MRRNAKEFDCVEMKNRIQAEMLAEYAARKDEYPSFVDFIKARADKSAWVRQARKKLRK